jgi:hypothetical protein
MASTLDKILAGQGLTLVPLLHLQQIDLFLWRKGIEIYPLKDKEDVRQKFLADCWKKNRTSLYLSDIWERGGKTGSVLLYVRPDGQGSYCMSYYQFEEFEPLYDGDGHLVSVTITTTYADNRHFRMRLSANSIEKWDSDKPIDSDIPDLVTPNPYGYVPCVIIDNRPTGIGRRGKTEFCDVKNQIEAHDWQVEQVHNNLEFYGEGIFYSSRTRAEMVEAGLVQSVGVAEQQGYRSPVGRSRDRVRARRVVDNIDADEVPPTFVTPPTIPTETMTFLKRFAEEIRTALGGVAETTNALERLVDPSVIKVVMARAIATASRRAVSYLDFGICAAYEMIVAMAEHDLVLPVVDSDRTVLYRYLGDVFQDSSQDTLTKSIVSRNLLRLGVNVEECIRYLFPDKRDAEISQLLQDGFAYEFLNGIATVAKTLLGAKAPDGSYAIDVESVINKVLDGRPTSDSTSVTPSSPESGLVLPRDSGGSSTVPQASGTSTNGASSTYSTAS